MLKITQIKTSSKWIARKDFNIGIGSDSRNPNTRPFLIPKGTELIWDGDAPNGNVWFIATVNGITQRGKMDSGNIINVINDGKIELADYTSGRHIVYNEEYLKVFLNIN